MSIEKQGSVQEFGASSNGKPKVKIDGQWYFLGKTKMDDLKPGDRISFEASAFGERGDLWGINKWGKLPSSNGTGMQQAGPPTKVWDETVPRSLASDDATLRFISNCVGQAIAAKTIVDPTDIEIWVLAARNALKEQR